MQLQIIGTGSSGNCYALHAERGILLLDAGLPVRTILRSIPEYRSKPITACLVTHEHGDHAKGALEIAHLGIPIYASSGTLNAIGGDSSLTQLNALQMRCPVTLGEFTVLPFETQHDAAEPCGFIIRYEPTGETILYATDTYYLRYTYPGINYWIVECNYIDEIVAEQLASGQLSQPLRNRLNKSHMSLRRLLDALRANDLTQTRAIVLVHLSDERSDERAMVQAVKEVSGVETVAAAAGGMRIDLELAPF